MKSFLRFLNGMMPHDPNLIGNLKSIYLESLAIEPPEHSYGAGLLFICPSTKRVLLALRSHEEEDGDVWCSLGGKGEAGETPMKTAVREVYEEGHISPDQYQVVQSPLHVNQNTPKFKFFNFLAIAPVEFTPQLNDEHTQFGWFTPEEMNSLKLHFGTKAIFSDTEKLKVINSYLNVGI